MVYRSMKIIQVSCLENHKKVFRMKYDKFHFISGEKLGLFHLVVYCKIYGRSYIILEQLEI